MAKNNRRRKSPPKREERGERESRNGRFARDRGVENDLSWYSRYPNLLVAAGSLPYPYRPGMNIDFGTVTRTAGSGAQQVTASGQRNMVIPGVMAIDWIPSIGTSKSATDPASILGKEIYTQVRKVYSGSLDADAPDYVMYVLALDSIFAYIAWLKRLYRVLTVWTPDNYVLPDVVLTALGMRTKDIESLRTNRTQLWQLINELILQSRKFHCPSGLDIVNRHYWMSDNIYTDEASINSQFYLFNLKGVFQFGMLNMSDGNPGPGLKMVVTPNVSYQVTSANPLTPSVLYEFGRQLIDALVAWDDAYTIAGYLKRAYEGQPTFIVDELPLDQPFNPVFVPEVLAQIENLRTVPNAVLLQLNDYSGFNITQDVMSNAVIANPQYTVSIGTSSNLYWMADTMQVQTLNPVLSIRSDAPTVGDTVIASRLHATVDLIGSTGANRTYHVNCATEIPLAIRFHNVTRATDIYGFGNVPQFYEQTNGGSTINNNYGIGIVFGLEQFDWHPFIYWQSTGTPTAEASLDVRFQLVGDTHNVTTFTSEVLKNLHKICIYSELNAFTI